MRQGFLDCNTQLVRFFKESSRQKRKLSKEPESVQESVTVEEPDVCIDHDDLSYYIEVELPGVDKGHVELSVGEQSLCMEAACEEIIYLGCFSLAHAS
jgi:HSP20 family molecular chaperone IbpA